MKDIRLEKLLELTKQIGELYPDADTSLMMHGFLIKDLDENKWEVEAVWNSGLKSTYLKAKLKEGIVGIGLTLFD